MADNTPDLTTYSEVWFNVEDFNPEASGTMISQSEFWFYHFSSNPWDTSSFYAEVWNGDSLQPITLVDQTLATAINLSPVFVVYDPPLEVEPNFWVLENTEFSAGGWPSIIGDGTPGNYSFYNDGFLWEPWGEMGDYFIRAHGDFILALSNTSWGAIKAVF